MQNAFAAYASRDWAEAERQCRRMLQVRADHFDALTLLGIIAAQTQRLPEAADLFGRAAAANPREALAHLKHGNALHELQRMPEALASYERALQVNPGFAEAHSNRGTVLLALYRLDEALASFQRALELCPGSADTLFNLGTALHALQRPVEAAARYAQALELDPANGFACNNLGTALKELGRPQEALACFEKTIALQAGHAEAYSNLANALEELGRPEEALARYEQAIRLEPSLEYLQGAWLHARAALCDWTGLEDETASLLERIERGEKASLPFDILALTSSPGLQRKAAEIWMNDRHPPRAGLAPAPARAATGKIHIGYFSADFHDHATTYLMAGLLEQHDRAKFRVTAVSFGPDRDDAMRRRVAAAVDEFIDVRNRSDRDVALLSASKGVDIAVDLKGFTQGSRVGIFACRAAPLQVGYLGYPGTMAASCIDYLIADDMLIPAQSRRHYTEKIAYLPDSYQVNDAGRRIAERTFARAELGLPDAGFVFCCFNKSYKINPGTFAGWMRILARVEGSVLWLLEGNPTAAGNLRREAERQGVAAHRLAFARPMPLAEHLARHRAADLFLDTLPYGAHTTASDALWAGLPVLTCTGESFASRVSASLLNAIELPELIAESQDAYEALAIELATNPRRLRQIAGKLAEHRLAAPLFDTARFARHLEAAFAQMHERRLAGLPPDHLFVLR